MPSPFPGMDPYLEHPSVWTEFYHRFITYLADYLNERVRPRYRAHISERVYLVQPDQIVVPDVLVRSRAPKTARSTKASRQQSAVLDLPLLVTAEPIEIHEGFIELKSVRESGTVITTIELLSPTNKGRDTCGHRAYRKKQAALLGSRTHLLEIDFLRKGWHTVAIPRDILQMHTVWDYVVCLHRGGAGNQFEVWPITLRDRLPRVAVPLSEADDDVILDLQAVFTECYERGDFAADINYQDEPAIRLPKEDVTWADAWLREKGQRD